MSDFIEKADGIFNWKFYSDKVIVRVLKDSAECRNDTISGAEGFNELAGEIRNRGLFKRFESYKDASLSYEYNILTKKDKLKQYYKFSVPDFKVNEDASELFLDAVRLNKLDLSEVKNDIHIGNSAGDHSITRITLPKNGSKVSFDTNVFRIDNKCETSNLSIAGDGSIYFKDIIANNTYITAGATINIGNVAVFDRVISDKLTVNTSDKSRLQFINCAIRELTLNNVVHCNVRDILFEDQKIVSILRY